MKLGRILLLLGSGIFALYGLLFSVAPVELALLVTGAVPASPSALIDMRATYGGMSIALGIIFMLLALQETTIRVGVVGLLLVMVCMAITRLVGIAMDGDANTVMYAYLALEIVAAALCGLALGKGDKETTDG
ncbi:MAG: DUF4345 domain-containing protein [Gammaproteobacteria bacterium]